MNVSHSNRPQRLRDIKVPAGLWDGGSSGALRGDAILRDGRVAAIEPSLPTDAPRILIPALVEAHCHLDKCHTIDRLGPVGGDLSAAIDLQRTDKPNWTENDIRARAERGLTELWDAGCSVVRSHVDWGEAAEAPMAWRVLRDLRRDWAGRIDLDLAALVNVAMLADPATAHPIAQAVARAKGSLGTFVLDQPERTDGVKSAFALADRHGLALDFHVEESLAGGLDGLDLIADTAIATLHQGPVLCGHACGLMNRKGDVLTRLTDRLAQSGVFVAALPTTNLYLQDRTDGTPDRRGLTRLRELRAATVPVVVGSDNVADAFCPTGQHDPMAALHLASLAAHLDPPFDQWLPMVTTDAARAVGRAPVHVKGAAVHDLRLSMAASVPDLIAGRAGPPVHVKPFPEPVHR